MKEKIDGLKLLAIDPIEKKIYEKFDVIFKNGLAYGVINISSTDLNTHKKHNRIYNAPI